MKLNELKPKAGSTKQATRVGRGIGSGKGKTCGSGHKGQKARAGVAIKGFEGGQMPIYMRMPKRGFNARVSNNYTELTIMKLAKALADKKVTAKEVSDADTMKKAGLINQIRDGVKLIGTGEISTKLDITVAAATKGAIAAIEKAGGQVTILPAKVTGPKTGKTAKPRPDTDSAKKS